jgi:hypothetical protein
LTLLSSSPTPSRACVSVAVSLKRPSSSVSEVGSRLDAQRRRKWVAGRRTSCGEQKEAVREMEDNVRCRRGSKSGGQQMKRDLVAWVFSHMRMSKLNALNPTEKRLERTNRSGQSGPRWIRKEVGCQRRTITDLTCAAARTAWVRSQPFEGKDPQASQPPCPSSPHFRPTNCECREPMTRG